MSYSILPVIYNIESSWSAVRPTILPKLLPETWERVGKGMFLDHGLQVGWFGYYGRLSWAEEPYLHQNKSVQLGDGLDTVLHFIIRHLDETAVALPPHHGIEAVPRHPGVHLDLLQLDSLSRILHQHLTDEGYQLRRQVGGCGNLTLLITIVIILSYDPPVMAVFGSCYK